MPSSWRSRAASRWSGVTSGLLSAWADLDGSAQGILALPGPAMRFERHRSSVGRVLKLDN